MQGEFETREERDGEGNALTLNDLEIGNLICKGATSHQTNYAFKYSTHANILACVHTYLQAHSLYPVPVVYHNQLHFNMYMFVHPYKYLCMCVTLHLTQYGDNCRWEACTTNHRKSETRRQGVGPCTASSCNVESLNRTCHCCDHQVW